MLSEKQKKGNYHNPHQQYKASAEMPSSSSPTTSRRCMYGRGHSMDVTSFAVPEDFELTQSSYSVFTSLTSTSTSSLSQDNPSIHRSVEDHRPLLSSLRQRSSSLPRILPPIFDDESEKVNLSTHRKSIAGSLLNHTSMTMGMATAPGNTKYASTSTLVREMQKFVCRQADDVSHLLPLPLPTKYSLIIKEEDEESIVEDSSDFLSPLQTQFALINLAKVHAASLAMKRIAPQLFEDVIKTLDERKDSSNYTHHHPTHHHHHSSPSSTPSNTASSIPTIHAPQLYPNNTSSSAPSGSCPNNNTNNHTLSSVKIRREDIENRIINSPFSNSTLRSLCQTFLSPESGHIFGLCLNEDINVKTINFRYAVDGEGEIVSCKFDRMSASTVGPILGDLYTFFFNCIDPETLRGGSLDLKELLKHYHSSLVSSCSDLKIQVSGLQGFEEFLETFKNNVKPGCFISFLLNTKKSGLHDKNEAKVKMETLMQELIKI
ncbi:unnamed protein product [Lepeophtheirus salmonis]|uniref:(salmon louse) hypothetical protein n=1 Tax=Lepeophtheirus salmonis TaxID=72036 RepID=A0A7R8CTJ5_LEPSM|nr:unnamed protein product [Lepeophtheirus salmonis]CAF2924346.1 unnamed protein product [Lepeophtheirus salmonis]